MKPALTYDAQVDLLRHRGLALPDEAEAKAYLRDFSYYRFSAYARPYQIAPGIGGNDNFQSGSSFERIRDLAEFDSALRKLVLGGLEQIEIAVRALLAHSIAVNDTPTAYGNYAFYQAKAGQNALDSINQDLDRANEDYIEHHNNKHGANSYPPIWVTVECLSFGTLSKILGGAKSGMHLSAVAGRWSLNPEFFRSLTHHFAYVRNVCAHHSRLWNRSLSVPMKDFLSHSHPLHPKVQGIPKTSLYRTLLFESFLLTKLDPGSTFEHDLFGLINKDQLIATGIGFPLGHNLERF